MEKTFDTSYGVVTLKTFFDVDYDTEGYEVYVDGDYVEGDFISYNDISLDDEEKTLKFLNNWLEANY